jgi:alpha-tubulin suppressor-like RCC1 family protein
MCWGRNDFGQLGVGSTVDSSVPVAVAGLSGVTQIAVGGAHACALLGDGTVSCWGHNVAGQLGDGSYLNRTVPVAVSGITNATAIGAGSQHTCALLATGAVQCWGSNLNDAIGVPSLGTGATNVPVTVDGLSSGVSRVSVGQAYNCVIMTGSRELRCWGSNTYGNLGVGDTTNRTTPTAVVDMASDVQSVSAGGWVTCAVMNTGNQGRCWGFGMFGALGNGGSSSSSSPVNVSGTGANAGFPAPVTVTVTATSGRTAAWSGTLRISGPVG